MVVKVKACCDVMVVEVMLVIGVWDRCVCGVVWDRCVWCGVVQFKGCVVDGGVSWPCTLFLHPDERLRRAALCLAVKQSHSVPAIRYAIQLCPIGPPLATRPQQS